MVCLDNGIHRRWRWGREKKGGGDPQYLHETVNTTMRHANVKTTLNPFFSTIFTQWHITFISISDFIMFDNLLIFYKKCSLPLELTINNMHENLKIQKTYTPNLSAFVWSKTQDILETNVFGAGPAYMLHRPNYIWFWPKRVIYANKILWSSIFPLQMLWLYDYESANKDLTVKVYCMGHISLIQLSWNVAGTGPHGWSAYFGIKTHTQDFIRKFKCTATTQQGKKKSLF